MKLKMIMEKGREGKRGRMWKIGEEEARKAGRVSDR